MTETIIDIIGWVCILISIIIIAFSFLTALMMLCRKRPEPTRHELEQDEKELP